MTIKRFCFCAVYKESCNASFKRINDVHLTNAQKRAAREKVNRGPGG